MNALSLLATGLTGNDIEVQTDGQQLRAVLTDGHLVLPGAITGQQRPSRAAVAHAAAHRRYSAPGRPVRGLKPMGIAIVSAIEDARVERLMSRDYPGLRRWFLDSSAPRPAPDDLSFAGLVTRMDRVLMDPRQQDDNHWVNKARSLFEETVARAGLHDYDAFRSIAAILANDLGQMRVRFDPQQHVVPAPYRDDNSYLWDFGVARPPPEDAVSLQQATAPRSPMPVDAAGEAPPGEAAEPDPRRFCYPEWDHRIDRLRPDWCTVIEKLPAWQGLVRPSDTSRPPQAPLALARARRVNRARRLRRQWEGDDIDLNAAIEVLIDRRLRLQPEPRMFMRTGTDLGVSSILVLLDLSESANDRAAAGTMSLLDIEKQAALLLAGAATRDGDRFAVHGFSSNTRAEVYYTRLIEFGATPTPASRAQVAAVQARYSTRIGAAIRHATAQLQHEPVAQRAILLVTDGTPTDIDVHDPRYLIEDARAAVLEARQAGVRSYCVAVDAGADAYARRIFGSRNYCIATDPRGLPAQLQRACARLAAN
jgi:nitric oxide reductase NorD protein